LLWREGGVRGIGSREVRDLRAGPVRSTGISGWISPRRIGVMGYLWVVWVAVALGQTTQPASAAGVPASRPAAASSAGIPASRPAAAAPSRPTADEPAGAADLGRLASALGAGQPPDTSELNISELSGNPVDIDVTADGTIILYGDEKDVAILEAFIRRMDEQPIYRPEFKIFTLKSADAADLAQKIQQLWDKAKKPVRGIMRPEDRITLIPETRANLLMVAATQENMEVIAGIIEQLDQPSLGELVTFESVQLHHIKAVEAEAILKDMLRSLQQRRGAKRELVTIQVNPRMNMLLINAPPEDLKQIKQWIQLIDVPPTAETGGVVKVAIFPLEKASAADVDKALSEMLRANTETAKAIQERSCRTAASRS